MKKIAVFLLTCISIVLLCACSANKQSLSDTMNSYERQQYSISKEYPDTTIHVLDSSKYKCLYFESKFEREEGNAAFVIKDIYEYEYETEKVTKLSFLSDAEKNGSLFYYAENDMLIMIDTEKNISLLNSDRNAVAKTNITELTFSNRNGDRYQIESVINARSDGKYVYMNGINPYHQGIVFVLDMSLKEKTAFLAGEGVILIALWNEQVQFFDAQNRILYRYDEESNEVISAGKIKSTFAERSTTANLLPGDTVYDVLYYTSGNRNSEKGTKEDYLVGVKGKREEILFDFTTMGIDNLYVELITRGKNDTYWVWGTTIDGEMVLYRFTLGTKPRDYSLKAQRKCCKIGSLLPVEASFQYALNQFNNTSDEYYFEIMVYQRIYQDRDAAMMHMFLDCKEGVLDGLILDNLEDEFIDKDALYDLNDYLRQSEVVSKDRFITHYLESVTSSEGDIYALYPSFRAFGYAYEDKIDFSDLTKYEELCDEKQPFFSFRGEEDALGFFLTYSGDQFVDEKNGVIHVQEPGFKTMLAFIKDQMECKIGQFDPVMQYCFGESKATRVQISEPTDYLYFNELFHKQVVFSNVAADGLVIGERKGVLGVCNSSEKKEALYAFYDFLFHPVFYHTVYFSGMNMPVVKEEYQLWKDFFLASEDYEDKYGKYNPKYDFEIGMGAAQCMIEVGSITEVEASAAIKALQEIEYVKPMKNAYKMIILEGAQEYFVGNRDIDDVCAAIENRLRIALEENKGSSSVPEEKKE